MDLWISHHWRRTFSTKVSSACCRLSCGSELCQPIGWGCSEGDLGAVEDWLASFSQLETLLQVPMVPIAKPDEIGLGSHQQTQGLNTQPDLYSEAEQGVPTMIVWNLGGNSVSVTGSWDNWSIRYLLSPVFFILCSFMTWEDIIQLWAVSPWMSDLLLLHKHLSMELVWGRQPLQRTGRDFTLIKVLPSGVYQFKFFVDGQWRYSPDLPAVSDDTNNFNNILDVQVSFIASIFKRQLCYIFFWLLELAVKVQNKSISCAVACTSSDSQWKYQIWWWSFYAICNERT